MQAPPHTGLTMILVAAAGLADVATHLDGHVAAALVSHGLRRLRLWQLLAQEPQLQPVANVVRDGGGVVDLLLAGAPGLVVLSVLLRVRVELLLAARRAEVVGLFPEGR